MKLQMKLVKKIEKLPPDKRMAFLERLNYCLTDDEIEELKRVFFPQR